MASEDKPIRVLLVDDHAVVRSGLGAVMTVNDDLALIGEACDGEEAVRLSEKYQPDVVLMDLMMPVMDGVTATRIILERSPAIKVIVLTSFKEKELVEGALQAGAVGYLLKTVSADELASAIRGAVAGQYRLSPEASQMLDEGGNAKQEPST